MTDSLPPSGHIHLGDDRSLRLFVDSVKDYAIFMLDPAGHVVTWNVGAQRTKGYSAAEIIGQHFSRFYTPEDVAALKPQRLLELAARDGLVEDEGWRLRKDGSRFWADVVLTAVRDEDGTLAGFGKVTRDLTERRSLEEAERHARARAEAASLAKDEFLAIVSHELRTPLNVIVGEMFRLRKTSDTQTAAQGWDSLDRNVRLLTRLVEDLLDLSRAVSGKLRVDPQPVDLARIAHDVVAAARSSAEIKGVTITSNLDATTGFVLGDPVRLHQVIWNLLSNAIKFTPSGGSVSISVGREAADAVLRVSDTGVGFNVELQGRLFDAFSQGDPSTTRAESGLGLGLAIVKRLVEAHGGRVTARSEGLARGATFEVCLPLPAVLPVDTSEIASSSLRLDDIRVLVVDDQLDARESLCDILRHFGAQVQAAGGVREALNVLPEFRPHVLLADIAMPGEDGYALIEQLRRMDDPVLREMPAAALTAFSATSDRMRVLSAGYQSHVPKPFSRWTWHSRSQSWRARYRR